MARDDKAVAIYEAFEGEGAFDPALPEKNLLRAMLARALQDLNKSGSIRKGALEFFLSPEDDYIFSFQSICNYLAIDPNSVLIAAGIRQRGSNGLSNLQ